MKGWGLNVYPLLSMFGVLDEAPYPLLPSAHRPPPYGRSKHTVAQDRRAAKKRAAVKRAKAKGQTRPAKLTNYARRNARRRRWAA